jgi:hypothetical protein
MPAATRAATYVILGSLWLSGCVWLCLDRYFAVRGPFGTTPHPWAAPLLLWHGIIAVASLYLLGWMTARHVARWWPHHRRRLSGGTFAGCLVLLTVSGFALFFLTDEGWQQRTASLHDIVGLAVTVFGLQHGFLWRRREGPRHRRRSS